MKIAIQGVILGLLCCFMSQSIWASGTATISTGGETGVYYPVCKAICHVVNHRSGKYGFRYEAGLMR